ncbi:MAG: ABC transporter permease [Dehalococcoidales bacterium]|jgi:ABC-2 type transport system permease protein|nr:ABC transporter permease [Dehalococcoidales bacterium]MDD5604483.1 ABC transporter permease [Dehalococcoidales bacterium]MDX9985864.1 ABC transporter permease [Dehalococcoidales bacterium]NLE89620.1 ABC transporter permease [Dehalococcoidales bacterium]
MKGFIPLLKKEVTGQLRTYKLVIVAGIFLFFGISTPFLLKYLPEILKLAGEGMIIELPPPTAVQSLAEYASTIGQVGLLLAVLLGMGSISGEMKSGTAIMTLSKPVSRSSFVGAKMIALSLTFLLSLAAASIVSFIYTVLLIEGASVAGYVGLNLLLALFLMFCLAITLFCSSLFRRSLAAGGTAIALLISQAALSAIPIIGDYMPGKLMGWGVNLISGNPDEYWGALAVTAVLTVLSLYFAQKILRNKDL